MQLHLVQPVNQTQAFYKVENFLIQSKYLQQLLMKNHFHQKLNQNAKQDKFCQAVHYLYVQLKYFLVRFCWILFGLGIELNGSIDPKYFSINSIAFSFSKSPAITKASIIWRIIFLKEVCYII